MPSRFATMKRNTPNDFEESERPVKMMRSERTPAFVRALKTMAPTQAPTTASSPIEGALKRKCEALSDLEDVTSSKRVRLGAAFGVSGTTTTSLMGCRGGKKRAKRLRGPKGAFVAKNDKATAVNTSPPSAVEDTAEVSASTEEEAAVTASEDTVKAEGKSGEDSNEATTGDISTPSAGEDTAEVSKAEEEDAVATATECAEDYLNACVSKDIVEVPTTTEEEAAAIVTECAVKAEDNTDAPAEKDTAEVSALSEGDAAVTATKCNAKAENDSDNSSEPVNNSRKSVSGSIESVDSTSSSEPASSSQKSANGSTETLDTVLSASESEEAPKKATKTVAKKERYITGLVNNGYQCFANATLQFFDAAMDGHDLDVLLGNDVSIRPFSVPKLTPKDEEGVDDIEALKRGETPVGKIGIIKASMRAGIKSLRKLGKLKEICQRKQLRALLSQMRGSKGTAQPKFLSPMVLHQVLAFGGADESDAYNHLDGTTQEDCLEYFNALMTGATSKAREESDAAPENGAEGAAALESLFEIKSEIAKVCKNSACDYKGTVQVETTNTISTSVWDSKKNLELTDMMDVSSTSTVEGFKCPKCGEETIADVTELKETSDNLVVHINRVDASGNGRKLQTKLELPLTPVEICGKRYILNAVVRHRGGTVHRGHYTIVRRRSPEWMTDENSLWYVINDHHIQGINISDVRDGTKYGHSAMLLFKAL
ncbi:hypothetical protein Q7P36_008481 [Cladosporium allicinum]